jgi:hypothetical protein
MRTVTKVCLNSLWGKYGQKPVLTSQVNTKDAIVLHQHMRDYMDDKIEDLEWLISHDTAVINYKKGLAQQ